MDNLNEGIINIEELEEIAGRITEPVNLKKEFTPWHKPRKHWVRSCQWRNELKNLIEETCYDNIPTVKYFSFPGADCLDIKILSEECHSKGKFFYFQGIESSSIASQKAQNVILSQFFDLDYIDKNSQLHAESKFEEIGIINSSLYSKIATHSPFHILNLDFTNSIFSNQATMKSICALLNRQLDQQYLKWQLYITTRCDIETIDIEILQQYMENVLKNCNENEEFTNILKEDIYVDLSNSITMENLINPSEKFEKIVVIAFLKWLIALSIEKNVKVKLLSSAEYTIRDDVNTPDMISLVLQFKKNEVPVDPTQINFNSSIDEHSIACDICSKFLKNIKNIDDLLQEKPELEERLTNEIKIMLENIGYDISLYPYN